MNCLREFIIVEATYVEMLKQSYFKFNSIWRKSSLMAAIVVYFRGEEGYWATMQFDLFFILFAFKYAAPLHDSMVN